MARTNEVDVVVIGMGPGGEYAAQKLSEAGLDVVGIERDLVGGECPFYGCITSKMMIRAADVLAEARRAGDLSGEVDVRPTADGPVTMLLLRQLSGEETWSVLGAATDDIQVESPSAGQAVGDTVVVRGRGRAFEGVIDVAVLADGDDDPIGSGTVMGGGDELRPFEGAIERDSTDAARGALVLFTRSAKDGAVWSASVLRIAFAGAGLANPASVYCEEQGGTVEIEETDDGQRGVCVLPDGTRVDEWDLYRDRARAGD